MEKQKSRLKALQNGILTSSNADPVLTKNGFSNWKNAMEKKKGFQKHESSESHIMKALARFVTTPATVMVMSMICYLNDMH